MIVRVSIKVGDKLIGDRVKFSMKIIICLLLCRVIKNSVVFNRA